MAKVDCISIRLGNIVDFEGKLCRVVKTDHVTPGRRMAVAHIQMKDIRTGIKYEQRYNSGQMVEKVTLESSKMQYLFASGDKYTFMDQTSYEQYDIPAEVIGDEQVKWLAENMEVSVDMFENTPVSVVLPTKVEATIVETDAVVKGQTASGSFKPAKLNNGVSVQVPPYITEGTVIVINTTDSTFQGRAQS